MIPADFFVAGGTLRSHSPSYVTRPADRELFEHVLMGEFCYVLTSRQMGKSSLMVQTAQQLKDRGWEIVIVDLTSIGTVSVDEWYLGLLTRIKNGLRLSVDVAAWWAERRALGAPQRFREFLHDIALVEIANPITIFIDEIDTTINFAFRDDFFAAIRAMYNARASDSLYNQLTFVLLGVATPTDLIQDRERTPFNIGRRIDLHEFSYSDAHVLQEGLDACYREQGERLLARIFYWTEGHPYLTQKLCLAVTNASIQCWDDKDVDDLVERNFFAEEARKDPNLTFVQDRVQASSRLERRRMLKLYSQVYHEKTIPDDDRSPIQNYLELFGLVRVEQGKLRVRNKIYRRVFNPEWISANMPANTPQVMAITASLIAVLLIAVTVYSVVRGQTAPDVQAQIYRESFHTDSRPTVRIEALANLFNLGSEYNQQALELFYSLGPSEQRDLFLHASAPEQGPNIMTVVKKVSVTLDQMPNNEDIGIMEAMVSALNDSQQSEAEKIAQEIDTWKTGRNQVADKHYQQALASYSQAIALSENDSNPVMHYDRAMLYIRFGNYENALTDLDRMITIARTVQPTPTPTATSVRTYTPTLVPPSPTPDSNTANTFLPTASALMASPTLTPTSRAIRSESHNRFIDPRGVFTIVREVIRGNPKLRDYLQKIPGKYEQIETIADDIINVSVASAITISPSLTTMPLVLTPEPIISTPSITSTEILTLTSTSVPVLRTMRGVNMAYQYTGRIDSSGFTRMRVEPNASSARVGLLRNGDQVEVLRDDVESWYEVRIHTSSDPAQQGVEGWIERWLVDDVAVPAQPPTWTPLPPPPSQTSMPRPSPLPRLRTFVVTAVRSDAPSLPSGERQSCVTGRVVDHNGNGVDGARLYVNNGGPAAANPLFSTVNGGYYQFCGLGGSAWSVVLTYIPGPARLAHEATALIYVDGTSNQGGVVNFGER